MLAQRLRTAASTLAGVVAALAAWEAMLRPISQHLRVPPRPEIACDTANAPIMASRQLEEGGGLAHYTECGARLTGNAPMPGAPFAVLLGDSHVAAREVSDGETMGAYLERIARAAGRPLNVRQYGWGGSSAAQYVVAAPDVIRRWKPAHVVVLLSLDDFGSDTTLGIPPRFVVDASGAVRLDTTATPARRRGRARRLVLATLIARRRAAVVARAPRALRSSTVSLGVQSPQSAHMDPTPRAEVADAALRALKSAYGDRLLLVYLTDVRATGDEVPLAETMFGDACAKAGARCLSTRSAMLEARTRGTLARGFSTTVIGIGHLNARGHELVAREVWKAIQGTR